MTNEGWYAIKQRKQIILDRKLFMAYTKNNPTSAILFWEKSYCFTLNFQKFILCQVKKITFQHINKKEILFDLYCVFKFFIYSVSHNTKIWLKTI